MKIFSALIQSLLVPLGSGSLLGRPVTGSLKFGSNPLNFLDPAFGLVPAFAGPQPDATVSEVDAANGYNEFEYLNGFSGFSIDIDSDYISLNQFPVNSGGLASSWIAEFTGLEGPSNITDVVVLSDSFNPALTVSFGPDWVTLQWSGGTLANSPGNTIELQVMTTAEPTASPTASPTSAEPTGSPTPFDPRAEVDRACPCEDDWRNRGQYVRCVAQGAGDLLEAGLITQEEKDAIVCERAQSASDCA